MPANTSALSADGNIVASDSIKLNFGSAETGGSILNTGTISSSGSLTVNTGTLTNEANQVNVGQIWSKVKGGYVDTTGTVVQPGGFMSAANMDLNVQTLKQIGGALQQLNADGTVDQAGTQQMLAALEQQLGSGFTQTTLSDHLHTDFVKAGGGLPMVVVAVIAIAASIITAGAAAAAFGVVMTQLSIGSVLIGALGGMVGSAVSQVASGQDFSLGQMLKAGAIGALSAGAMGALHLADLSSLHTLGSEIANGTVQMADVGNALVTIGERGLVTASVDTAVEGGSFGRAFEGSVIGDLGAVGASAIGAKAGDENSWLAEKTPGNVLAHAALGCALSAADGTGCAGGAIGAGASAIASPYVRDALYDGTQAVTTTDNGNGTLTQMTSYNNPMLNTFTTGIAALTGGLAAGMAGANVQAGATFAENEVLNNTLSTKEQQLLTHAYSFEMPGATITRTDAVNTLAELKLAQNDPNLTATERGYLISASVSAFQSGVQAGVLTPNDAGALVSAAIGSMAFSGGGEGPLPSRASQSNVLPTTSGSRTAISAEGVTDIAAGGMTATVDARKFSEYIFKPGADHGKNVVFESLGYTADDSADLSQIWQTQAAQKYASGDFTLGKSDQYGQRINIEIALPGKGAASGQTSYLQSGWMIQPDGSLKLNTPFSGFTRSRK